MPEELSDYDSDPMLAVSPIEGRYEGRTKDLKKYFSEAALHRGRVVAEAEYLIKLSEEDDIPFDLSDEEKEGLRNLYENFDLDDAKDIKKIERKGWKEEGIEATNHDVKAVEYFTKIKGPLEDERNEFVHLALTSEDVTNLSYSLNIKEALEDVMFPAIEEVGKKLAENAEKYKETPMLAHTHGQPASPVTLGKEYAVYLQRLGEQYKEVKDNYEKIAGKLEGATGAMNAHEIVSRSYDADIDWLEFSKDFVEGLGLEHVSPTTQLNPRDKLANLFNSFKQLNNSLKDLSVDHWLWIHDKDLAEEVEEGEVGSSTMPHKVNPIDFENAEGNLTWANDLFDSLSDYITISRLQRDLSDSTVKRNIGVPFGHSLIAYQKLSKGLDKVGPSPNMKKNLEENPEVLTEAFQIEAKCKGIKGAYEQVKDEVRGKKTTQEELSRMAKGMGLEETSEMGPEEYIGLSADFVEKALQNYGRLFE